MERKKSGSREIQVVRRVLDANDIMAQRNRDLFARKKVFVLNVMSSPGSGKTTLLEKTLSHIMPKIKCAVIVGDICTTYDADRLAASGVPVIQVNTNEFGGDCHLAAHVIENREKFLGKRIDIASDEIDGRETTRILSSVNGHDVSYFEVPLEKLRAKNEDWGRMYDWFDKVGYDADIEGLKRDYPEAGWHSFSDWARKQDWSVLN